MIMASRIVPEQEPKSVRLDFKINLQDYPDIAELYLSNPRRFSVTTIEALALYALIIKKTGVIGLAHAANAVAIGGCAQNFPIPTAEVEKRVPRSDGGESPSTSQLSLSAAEALLSMDRDM